jgi:hypothetical protein
MHHVIIQLFFWFGLVLFFLDHGVMDCIFVMICHDKITCREIVLISFYFIFGFVNKFFLTPFAIMYMFVHFIYTKHINACIHQGLNPRPHGSAPKF